jgi:hypothetical protein
MTMIRVAAGVAILFLGRELNFLFSAIMAALIGVYLLPLLPANWPSWSDMAFLITLAVLAAVATILDKRAGYYVSGFLIGGYAFIEYFAPRTAGFPIVAFIVGSVIGAVLIGVFTDWAMILVSCLIGTYLIYTVLPLYGTAKTLAAAGIFIVGAIAQVIIFQSQKHSDR